MRTNETNYSQNNEQQIVLDYFKDFKGTCLSLGENDGKKLSNVYKVIQDGWKAVLVEPSPLAFARLAELHEFNNDVQLINLAVSDCEGFFPFNESGPHLKNGDIGLLSTLVSDEVAKWKPTGAQYREIEIECLTFSQLLELSNHKTFDLISIDIEGKDWAVLQQMNLKELGCKMLIIEHNSDLLLKNKIITYCMKQGMRLKSENYENLILTV